MGLFTTTESTNISRDMIKMSAAILNKTAQNCTAPVSTVQAISVSGCDDVNISGNELRNSISVNLSCVQNSAVDNKVSTLIEQQFKQMAEIKSQALGLGVGDSKISTNIVETAKDLSTTIVNEFVQNCAPSIFSTQSINVSDCKTANIVDNKLINDISAIVNCLQSSSAVSGVANDLQTTIDQIAKNKEEPIFDFGLLFMAIAGVFITIVVIVGLVLIFGLKSSSKVATSFLGASG